MDFPIVELIAAFGGLVLIGFAVMCYALCVIARAQDEEDRELMNLYDEDI